MERILIVTAFIPSVRAAGQNYTRRLINDLSTDFQVDLILFKKTKEEGYVPVSPSVRVLKVLEDSPVRKLVNVAKMPLLHPYFTNRFSYRLAMFISRISPEYDHVYFDFSQVFLYAVFARHPRKYLLFHDVIWQLYSRRKGLVSRLHEAGIWLSERMILKTAQSTSLCFSVKDQKILLEQYRARSEVIDTYLDERILALKPDALMPVPRQFCLYGAWSRAENNEGLKWFVEAVLPKLGPSIRLVVIGPGLSADLEKALRAYPNVTVRGFIENPYPVIAGSVALIAPLFEGAGVKGKVLEAFACGTHVIGTDIAFEGIEFAAGPDAVRCRSSQDFIVAIEKMASSVDQDSKISFRQRFRAAYGFRPMRRLFGNGRQTQASI
jgi:glycosyltransferase involved in cell wall biosynthesis